MAEIIVGVRLNGNSADLQGAINEAKGKLDALGASFKKTDGDTKKFDQSLNETSKGLDKAANGADSLGKAMAKVGHYGAGFLAFNGIKDFIGDVVNAGIATEKLNNTFKFTAGSVEGAFAEMAYAREVSERLGLELNSTASAYAKLSAASVGTSLQGENTRQIFEAVASASTVMGLSAAETEGALLAIGQMMSKGTVSAEELRGQLGERLPGAFQVAARAMGVSTAELGKMLEQGQVMSDDFLPKFAQELTKTLGDAPQEAMKGTQAQLNRLSNAWTDFKKEIAEAGVITLVLKFVEGSSNALKWFNHFVFNEGELADIQKQTNNPARIEALKKEQEILVNGGFGLAASNTLENRQKRLREIVKEIKQLEKEIGIKAPDGNSLPGKSAITYDAPVMPKIFAPTTGSGKETGGGYGPDINKRNRESSKKTPVDQDAEAAKRFVEQLTKQSDTLGMAKAQLLEYDAAHLKLSKSQKKSVAASIAKIKAAEDEKKATADALEFERLQREGDDRALQDLEAQSAAEQTAIEQRNKSYEDLTLQYEQANEDMNAALIKNDQERAKKQIEIEHQRAEDRINSLGLEGKEVARLLEQENALYEKKLNKIETDTQKTSGVTKQLGLTFTSAFEDAVISGKKLSDVLGGLAQDIERIILRKTFTEPLADAVGGINWGNIFKDFKFNAQGGVYPAGDISQYSGSVVTKPTFFTGSPRAFAKGGNVMGEAGAEGIFPLKKMANGDLGVQASGAGGGNVTVNIIGAPSQPEVTQTRDANGNMSMDIVFDRIKSELSRDVKRGGTFASALEGQYGLSRVAGSR